MTPRTEAGRWLLDHWGLANHPSGDAIQPDQAILAIEAEAACLVEPRPDAGLRERLVALIVDEADIRLPDGRLAIEQERAVALIRYGALAQPAPDRGVHDLACGRSPSKRDPLCAECQRQESELRTKRIVNSNKPRYR